jgi:hypothetical protein
MHTIFSKLKEDMFENDIHSKLLIPALRCCPSCTKVALEERITTPDASLYPFLVERYKEIIKLIDEGRTPEEIIKEVTYYLNLN